MTQFDPRERDMARDRGQVLYRYRPNQTFDHPGGYTAQVRQYAHDDAYGGAELDPGYLIGEAMRLVKRWRKEGKDALGTEQGSDRAPEYPEDNIPLAEDQYEVVIPGKVFCRIWPRVIRCARPGCGRVWDANDWQPGGDWPGACPRCGSREGNRQLQYLFVHQCGEVYPMSPPSTRRARSCPHTEGYRFDDKASRFLDFRWECLRCRASEPVRAFCNNPRCSWTEKMMSPVVHTASSAYAAKGLTLVNVPTKDFAARARRPAFIVATIGRWLGACSDEEADTLIEDAAPTEVPRVVLDSIAAMEAAGLTDQAQKLRGTYAQADVESVKQKVSDTLGFDPLGDDIRGPMLASNLSSYERVLGQPRIKLSDLRSYAASSGRLSLYATYDSALEGAGLSSESLALVTEFPVTYLGVGYCRGGFGPTEADLVAYKGRARRGQAVKTLLYANPTMTEALVFALQEDRVGRWLIANQAVGAAELEAAGGAKRWFAASLEGFDGQLPPPWDPERDPVPGDADYGPRLLFGLIHSMAHQLIRSLAVDSGYTETALSEYLFPHDLAFAIHPNGGSEFVIGGLRTVMEQNLGEVVARAVENDTCIYDPNCNDANHGADHGCMFLPETACQAWNWFVSRWYLFGDPSGSMTGYWSPALGVS